METAWGMPLYRRDAATIEVILGGNQFRRKNIRVDR
jgi:hypothetical protein